MMTINKIKKQYEINKNKYAKQLNEIKATLQDKTKDELFILCNAFIEIELREVNNRD
jgi:hypothetical protein